LIVPTAYEFHVARELMAAGGGAVCAGGVIGGVYGAANPEQEGWESSARAGFLWGCVAAFILVVVAGSS
jgi:hypothetical protein